MNLLAKFSWELTEKEYKLLVQEHWQTVRDIHFDEKSGTPYWINAAKKEGIDPKNDLDTLEDFFNSSISLCDENILKVESIKYFIPKSILNDYNNNYTSIFTSSGSMGKKKEVAWSETALDYIADYANHCLDRVGIRRGINWIIQGPYGLFQDTVRRTIAKRGGLIHSAGVETRNLKKEFTSIRTPEDFKNSQFMNIVFGPSIEFIQDVLAKEKIGGLVTAIQLLPNLVNACGFENIEAIYFSGMDIPKEMYKLWKEKLPHMKFIHSFGHHNLGFSYSTPFEGEPYYPPFPVSAIYIVDQDDPYHIVGYGQRGRHKILRMEPAFLWSQLDRDHSIRVPPQKEFKWDGFKDVKPSFS